MRSWDEAREAGVTRHDWATEFFAQRRAKKVQPKKKSKFLKAPDIVYPCQHRGEQVDETTCQACGGRRVSLKIFKCAKFEECTIDRLGDKIGPHCCKVCEKREP